MKQYLSIWGALLVASVTPAALAQEIKADAQAGAGKVAMCIGCHGIQGYQASFPEVYKVPKISGQNAPYIASALQAYKKGERRHPTMRGIADSLSDQDIADVAAYYANQAEQGGQAGQGSAVTAKAHDPSPDVAALIAKGACFSCHGEGFAKPLDPSYPKVAGQYADYLFSALKAYQHEGNGRLVGRSNPVMAGMAKQFTTAELKQLAGYIGSLPGPLQTIPEQRFR